MRFCERLLSESPANNWNEAYPIGNGIIGAMVDGGIADETIYFNDGGFWAGCGEPSYRPNDVYPHIKELTMQGKLSEAEELLWKDVYGEYAESYLPLCRLHITRNAKNTNTYTRLLDLTRAVLEVNDEGVNRQYFCSHRDGVFVMRETTIQHTLYELGVSSFVKYDAKFSLCEGGFSIEMSSLAPSHMDPVGHPTDRPVVYDDEHKGISAYTKFVFLTDGKVEISEDKAKIYNAKSLTILMANTLSTRSDDMASDVDSILNSAMALGYDDLLNRHIADYKTLYSRVYMDIEDDMSEDVTTIKALKKYGTKPSMSVLMFNYARYLMISASREDGNCMNLQGIWNADFKPPWSSAFTVNINIEMNYWIAEAANLSECHMPLMRQLKVLEASGRRTAREQLHTAGWCCGHNSDIWGHSNLTGRISKFNPSMYALFLSGGAWLATHIFTHYEYTGDMEFLREYYYILKGAAEFYMDYASKDDKTQYLVLCPGASPENTFKLNGERHNISKNATMDASIARHVMRITIAAASLVGDNEFIDKCSSVLAKLYPYQIGKNGTIMEWYGDYAETEKTHRHISHLYGLYPDHQISVESTPDLANAAYKTIKRRGKHGIGWSLSWKVCMLARLKMGDEANKVLKQRIRYYDTKHAGLNYGGCYGNLFSAPPMQIDGNFGTAQGVLEMLIQNTTSIELLPALPKTWQKGVLNGIKLKGNRTISFSWDNGKVKTIRVDGKGANIEIKANGKSIIVPMNETVEL